MGGFICRNWGNAELQKLRGLGQGCLGIPQNQDWGNAELQELRSLDQGVFGGTIEPGVRQCWAAGAQGFGSGMFGGTIEPGHSHCLQEHDGQDSWTRGIFFKQLHHICSSLEKRSNCQCPQDPVMAILPCCCLVLPLLEQNVHKWEIQPVLSLWGCFCQGNLGELLTLCGHHSPWGLPCREGKICWHFWLDFSGQRGFYRMAFCMSSSFSTRDHSYWVANK